MRKGDYQNDDLIAKVQPASSKCICLDEKNTLQQKLLSVNSKEM